MLFEWLTLKKKLVYELILCRGLILNIVFHSVNDWWRFSYSSLSAIWTSWGGRVDPDYLGIQVTEGKLCGRGYIQKNHQSKLKYNFLNPK